MTTREQWAIGALEYADWIPDREKVIGLAAHATVADVGAPNNPLALTEDAPDATDFDAAGVKAYSSPESGYGAWYASIARSPATAFLASESGGSAEGYARALGLTKVAQVAEQIKAGDPDGFLDALVVTEVGPSSPPGVDPALGEGAVSADDPSPPFTDDPAAYETVHQPASENP